MLRRRDPRSLRGWAQWVNMFHTEDRLVRLHELTGGWRQLLKDTLHVFDREDTQLRLEPVLRQ
ncbi:hypothetical protein [Streptomyces sp. NBC_01445]|uniref:hypothetical protein n=1 Tax=Streptomyces sp. NBC_01445 TaxID=2903869 RepID=UPI002DD922ED|nr:hypothetical protein [Streptomyces sp. NBC_01445]WSE02080.1 hypothetical protein OG574_00725 [Streptomyces sp. NBC_01445]WSE10250.1 hypothetical protein OG574_47285 [Streptomyces sp. NBC_01445]WSE11181.1 hypothetical protein OG574_48735 [Streptomyces sp. NBC_01445]